ncbi:MAG: ATP-binding cassette domain-containing protein [Coriobacteriales bacterium]|jgi:oligopeptide transport system ATP-binding protein|nr:ATP-binding cassette domain-containing protein [Coriobacteriales bacterium]
MPSSASDAVLKVSNLHKSFKAKGRTVHAVNNVSFEIRRGENFGLVGESGSGKSTVARTVIRLYAPSSGRIEFDGEDVSGRMGKGELALLRTRMQMIFQDPSSSLNPRRKVGDLVAAGLDINKRCANAKERSRRVIEMLEQVGLSAEQSERYPQQFSGGQKQRIGIARALIMSPSLVIADEPISALDVSIQAQIVNLMRSTQDRLGTSYLFISHDLSIVRYISDRIGVLHEGYLVESGLTSEIFTTPVHPYTRALLSAIPRPNPLVERHRQSLAYDPARAGIDYAQGDYHYVSPTHRVLATEKELPQWTQKRT